MFYLSLWIAFKLYLWNIEISLILLTPTRKAVVNCFQIVSLKYWNQRTLKPSPTFLCCELLSNCIFEILKSADYWQSNHRTRLWIAFKLYLWNIEISTSLKFAAKQIVVNCFQIVSLKYWNQLIFADCSIAPGCELLSNCIFEILKSASNILL